MNNREIFASWQGDGKPTKLPAVHNDYPVVVHGIPPGGTFILTEAEARRLVQGLLNVLNGGESANRRSPSPTTRCAMQQLEAALSESEGGAK